MSSAISPVLSLYHLPLHPASSVPFHVSGSFSEPRVHELVLVTAASSLDLFRRDENTGRLRLISTTPLFAEILAITAFRFLGATRDYLVVTSDSGELLIVVYDNKQQRMIKIQREVIGKTGMRRGVAGHYISVEPKGRALMVAALEKVKMTYILNRDSTAASTTTPHAHSSSELAELSALTISSPLEAHKSNILTLSLCALDVGYDNPVFCALEVDYAQEERTTQEQQAGKLVKYLTYYELDLGLNHVTRKHTERVDAAAYLLLTVPGAVEGPGGILIVCESYVIYHPYHPTFSLPRAAHTFLSTSSLRCYFPVRHGIDINPHLLMIAHTAYASKSLSFFLLQSEHGDLYKITLRTRQEERVRTGQHSSNGQTGTDDKAIVNVIIAYFDSIPPATGISVLKSGHLFSASESSSHYLFRIERLGEESDPDYVSSDVSNTEEAEAGSLIYFHTRSKLSNLSEESTMEGLHPMMDMKVSDPTQITTPGIVVSDPTPVIYALCGKGPRSSLRFLRHGLAMTELALSDLPATPTAVFTIKTNPDAEHHTYIIVSFASVTIVLSVGEQVNEVSDSGLLDNVSSLYVSSLSDGSMIQVHSAGIRHIKADKRINEWKPSGKKQILLGCGNDKNVVVCLSGGELIYFESDRHGMMIDMYRKDMMNDVAAITISPVEEGKMRGKWVIVSGYDSTVRVFSTDPSSPLQQMSVLAMNGQVSSLLVVQMSSEDAEEENLAAASVSSSSSSSSSPSSSTSGVGSSLYLYTGLTNGIMIRSHLDNSTAALSEHRKRFLGPRSLQLTRTQVRGTSAVLALSDRPWIDYSLSLSSSASAAHHLLPLSYDPLDAAAFFSSPQCPEGLVAIVGSTLRILTIDGLDKGEMFYSTRVPLHYTPRKMEIIPSSQWIAVIETDQNTYSRKERTELENIMKGEEQTDNSMQANADQTTTAVAAVQQSEEEQQQIEQMIGAPYAGLGHWASCVSLHSPPYLPFSPPFRLEMEDNEAAFSLAVTQFEGSVDHYLIVGTGKDLVFTPRHFTAGLLHVYVIDSLGTKLKLLHKTTIDEIPLALSSFQKRLLVGAGQTLRMYELGKKKVLLKNETKGFSAAISSIHVIPNTDRVVVGDLADGFHFLTFSQLSRSFSPFSDSSIPRFLTAATLLDVDTMAGADKFGNVFVCRLPPSLSAAVLSAGGGDAAVDVELATLANRYSRAAVTGGSGIPSTNKLQDIISFHTEAVVTGMVKVKFHAASSAPTFLLCATLAGSLIVFLPLTSREEIELLTHLEMHIRAECPSLTGRDHLAWRGSFLPVRGVIDGQMIEQFRKLKRDKQVKIAEEVVSTPAEMKKKIEELRNRIL